MFIYIYICALFTKLSLEIKCSGKKYSSGFKPIAFLTVYGWMRSPGRARFVSLISFSVSLWAMDISFGVGRSVEPRFAA